MRQLIQPARNIWTTWLDALAPYYCPGCNLATSTHKGYHFCQACRPLLASMRHNDALFRYQGPLAEGIKGLKYQQRVSYLPALTALFTSHIHRWDKQVDVVVPVPLHVKRLRQRGFNQSALLAKDLADLLGVPLATRLLRRTHHGPPQNQLNGQERWHNVRHAFCAKPLKNPIRILLFDDVRTTGATLEQAKKALCKAGATKVFSVALAGAQE